MTTITGPPVLSLLGGGVEHRRHPVVLSYGLGVDSTALLLRWLHEPDSRDFELSELLVITAMTGDEWPRTGQLVGEHIVPRLAAAGVRYAQVGRRSGSQTDGIVVFDDSRAATQLYLAGAYKLSDELRAAGTVPQTGGARLCSAKAKGWPLDRFLEQHVEGPFRQAIGFEAGEILRARRDAEHDLAGRTGFYPLIEWGWDRAGCERYIERHTGVPDWGKSACGFCPYALTNKAGRARTLKGWAAEPAVGLHALALEHLAICLNEHQGLVAGDRAIDLVREHATVLAREHEAEIERQPHALYEVRRLLRARRDDPTRAANASRHLRILTTGDREAMRHALRRQADRRGGQIDAHDGIERLWLRRRADRFPCREHFLVAAPVGAVEKGDPNFEQWWEALDAPVLFAA